MLLLFIERSPKQMFQTSPLLDVFLYFHSAFQNDDTLTTETDTNDEEFTEEEKFDALRQIAEEEQREKGNPTYQKYTAYQAEKPTAIVAYRLGDFYEVLGDKAVLLGNELDLTITSRDVGLKERIPMVGFPYHAAENYFAKIVKYHDLYIIENDNEKQFIERVETAVNRHIDLDTAKSLPKNKCVCSTGISKNPTTFSRKKKNLQRLWTYRRMQTWRDARRRLYRGSVTMKKEKTKPIPKYIVARIKKADTQNNVCLPGRTRFYSYLTKNDGELVKVTVAVRTRYKQWLYKQVAVHGLNSDSR